MKILLVNPNTSAFITDRMVRTAQATLGTAAEVVGVTAQQGPAVVGSRVENALASAAALELAAIHANGCDAVLLGISSDAGLAPLRELLEVPVTGMLEAGLLTACQLGGRVGLLTLGARMLPLYQEQAKLMGLDQRVVAWAGLELPSAFASQPDPAVAEALGAEVNRMVQKDGLDVVVLAGAVLAGCRAAVQPRVPVPVIDSLEAAAWQAVALGALRPAAHRVGSYARASGRSITGASAQLARRIA